ncbi:class I SAM-dependent methyltransferase [Patescibacteria group bacterium]|nr:class I SAM-dependent methyltransferase [Patescibacteria group bacterium]
MFDKNIQNKISEIRKFGKENNIPNVTENVGLFLNFIIKNNKNIKNVLEIGSCNGLSSIYMISELSKRNGKLNTIEYVPHSILRLKKNINSLNFDKYTNIISSDAILYLNKLNKKIIKPKYDLIFIDAMKKQYLDYYLNIINLIKKGSVIIFDDVIKYKYKMQNLYDYLEKENIKYTIINIDFDDGIMILKK